MPLSVRISRLRFINAAADNGSGLSDKYVHGDLFRRPIVAAKSHASS